MNLKDTLCQIDPNHHILHLAVLLFAWLSTPRPWHIAMPFGEGGNHSISLHPAGVLELLLRGRICFYVNWKRFRMCIDAPSGKTRTNFHHIATGSTEQVIE